MSQQPRFAVQDKYLIPVCDYPANQTEIPPSRMFIIKKGLDAYLAKAGKDAETYDASQGDGGASLDGVPAEILMKAAELHVKQGTGYDQPYGYDGFRNSVANTYWKINPATGWGPANVVAGIGGRDILLKAYDAMIYKGTGRVGDVLLSSAVPWISYNWGPYAMGLNVLQAPGDENDGWAYTEEGLTEAVKFATKHGRRIAGMLITSPDNPTGRSQPLESQIALAHKAIELGVEFVLFDWIYHWITEEQPYDINQVLESFSAEDRNKLMFLDGLTKSLGGSNVRSAHLIASPEVCKFVVSRASHGVFPNFYSQAVAVVAYEMGFEKAAASTIEPTNASRKILRQQLTEKGYRHIMGQGYYAFIDVSEWCNEQMSSIELGEILARDYGIAIVPGGFFSEAGRNWVRFSYALPPQRTEAAFNRLHEALNSIGRG